MRSRRRRWLPLSLLAALLPGVPAAAQEPSRVAIEARFEPAKVAPGGKTTLIVDVDIQSGFHLRGGKDSLPTKLEVKDAVAWSPTVQPSCPTGSSTRRSASRSTRSRAS